MKAFCLSPFLYYFVLSSGILNDKTKKNYGIERSEKREILFLNQKNLNLRDIDGRQKMTGSFADLKLQIFSILTLSLGILIYRSEYV
jgi:hypothetical protein